MKEGKKGGRHRRNETMRAGHQWRKASRKDIEGRRKAIEGRKSMEEGIQEGY